MARVSAPPASDITTSNCITASGGSHRATAPSILTSPPPIMPTWKARAKIAKTASATPMWIATPGHSGTPLTHQNGMAPNAIAAFSQLGMVRLRQSSTAATMRPAASNAMSAQESPPCMGEALDGLAFETVTGGHGRSALRPPRRPGRGELLHLDGLRRLAPAPDRLGAAARREGARQPPLRRRPGRLHREVSGTPASLVRARLERHRFRLAGAGRL